MERDFLRELQEFVEANRDLDVRLTELGVQVRLSQHGYHTQWLLGYEEFREGRVNQLPELAVSLRRKHDHYVEMETGRPVYERFCRGWAKEGTGNEF